ncbi:SpoIIE family protein phosphatase [bacterium]|nr:SpoIIE family protein phosphatase [bacterium]
MDTADNSTSLVLGSWQGTSSRPCILIADDNKLVRLKLARLLEGTANIDLLVAEDGEQAWDMLQKRPDIQVCILDWEMPGMDGVEVCRRIRASNRPHYSYVIILTARSERSDLYEGLRAGADDYITKPFDPIELQLKLQIALRITNLEQMLEEQNRELEAAYDIVAEGLQAAGRVQRQLMPDARALADMARRHRTFIQSAYEPCQTLGGDVICVQEASEDRVAICLADVSGHGIAAAMSAVLLHSCVRAAIEHDCTPQYVLERTNRFCCDELPAEVYATLVYALLDPRSGRLQLVVAGHPAPVYCSAGGLMQELESCMAPLGLFDDAADALEPIEMQMVNGDQLVIYTDGVIETRGPQGEFFELRRLRQVLGDQIASSNSFIPQALVRAVREWRGGPKVPLEDDMSVLSIAYMPMPSRHDMPQLVAQVNPAASAI